MPCPDAICGNFQFKESGPEGICPVSAQNIDYKFTTSVSACLGLKRLQGNQKSNLWIDATWKAQTSQAKNWICMEFLTPLAEQN